MQPASAYENYAIKPGRLSIKMDLTAQSIIEAWRIESYNWDSAIAIDTARDHLIHLSRDRFEGLDWKKALKERNEEFPEFFALYNYDWCLDTEAFDFPIETSLQVRTIDAAIGMWLANINDKPAHPHLSHIVARSTYLAKFKEVTPHVRKLDNGIVFLISPLGWLEFIHRYFAGFNAFLEVSSAPEDQIQTHCKGTWLNIAANLIASDVNRMDYFLPVMIDKIVQEVPEFTEAHGNFKDTSETQLSRDLAYAAHDFAICHEMAHIAADDFDAPDEERADRWGIATYFGSWGRRPPLHMGICRNDALRASIGPFAFSCALRALIGARIAISKRLGHEKTHVQYSIMGDRSRSLWTKTVEFREAYLPEIKTESHAKEVARVDSLLSHLLDYEVAFATFLTRLDTNACGKAAEIAKTAEVEALVSD